MIGKCDEEQSELSKIHKAKNEKERFKCPSEVERGVSANLCPMIECKCDQYHMIYSISFKEWMISIYYWIECI